VALLVLSPIVRSYAHNWARIAVQKETLRHEDHRKDLLKALAERDPLMHDFAAAKMSFGREAAVLMDENLSLRLYEESVVRRTEVYDELQELLPKFHQSQGRVEAGDFGLRQARRGQVWGHRKSSQGPDGAGSGGGCPAAQPLRSISKPFPLAVMGSPANHLLTPFRQVSLVQHQRWWCTEFRIGTGDG
jgi:hypothetical protein